MPSVTLLRPFSLFLIASQLVTTCSAVVGVDVAEHVRVAVHELVVHAARHVGQVEPALLVGQPGVEDDLEEQIAQLLLAGARMRPRVRPRRPVGPVAAASASASSTS